MVLSNLPPNFNPDDHILQDDVCPECENGWLKQRYWFLRGKRREPIEGEYECTSCDYVEKEMSNGYVMTIREGKEVMNR